MRKWCGLFLAGAVALLAASPSSAASLPYTATFTLELGSFPGVVATSSGNLNATTSGGALTGFTVPASVQALSLMNPVVPPIPLLTGVSLTSVTLMAKNSLGSFTVGASTGGGKMGAKGASVLFINGSPATIPLTSGLGIPGGKVTAKLLGLIPLTVAGQGWTFGKVSAISTPLGGGGKMTLARTGSHMTTGSNVHLNYVTPSQITIQGQANVASFGRLELDVTVPEAGSLLMLATGALVLGAASFKRRRA